MTSCIHEYFPRVPSFFGAGCFFFSEPGWPRAGSLKAYFYSCFALGGLAALILVLATAPDKTTALIVSIIGIGNIAGGVYMLRREPASILIFDLQPDMLLVRRWHPSGKKDSFYPLSAVSSVEVAIKEQTEGGHVYRPSLCLNESVTIPVSMFWYQKKHESEVVINEIQSFLNLSPNMQVQGDA